MRTPQRSCSLGEADQTYESRVVMQNDARRDSRHIGLQASFRLELLPKSGPRQVLDKSWNDAATDEYSAPRTKHQSDIACDRSQKGTEHVDR